MGQSPEKGRGPRTSAGPRGQPRQRRAPSFSFFRSEARQGKRSSRRESSTLPSASSQPVRDERQLSQPCRRRSAPARAAQLRSITHYGGPPVTSMTRLSMRPLAGERSSRRGAGTVQKPVKGFLLEDFESPATTFSRPETRFRDDSPLPTACTRNRSGDGPARRPSLGRDQPRQRQRSSIESLGLQADDQSSNHPVQAGPSIHPFSGSADGHGGLLFRLQGTTIEAAEQLRAVFAAAIPSPGFPQQRWAGAGGTSCPPPRAGSGFKIQIPYGRQEQARRRAPSSVGRGTGPRSTRPRDNSPRRSARPTSWLHRPRWESPQSTASGHFNKGARGFCRRRFPGSTSRGPLVSQVSRGKRARTLSREHVPKA